MPGETEVAVAAVADVANTEEQTETTESPNLSTVLSAIGQKSFSEAELEQIRKACGGALREQRRDASGSKRDNFKRGDSVTFTLTRGVNKGTHTGELTKTRRFRGDIEVEDKGTFNVAFADMIKVEAE